MININKTPNFRDSSINKALERSMYLQNCFGNYLNYTYSFDIGESVKWRVILDENVSKRQITSEFEVKVTIHNFTIFYSDNLSFKTPFFLFEIKSVGGSNSFDKEYTQYQFINRLFDKNNEIVSLADLNFDFFTRIDDCYWENKTLDENGYYVSSFDWASTDAGSFLQSGYEKYVITPHTGLLDYYEEIFYYRIKMPTQWFYSKLTFTLLKNSDSSEIILGFVLSGISGIILGLIIAKTARKKSGMT